MRVVPLQSTWLKGEATFFPADRKAFTEQPFFRYDPQFKLYPADVEMQAIINQRLWFDSSSLFQTFRDIFVREIVLAQNSLM